ncbi:MAG: chromate transporter [Candidatus Izemoplasmatales bacterium]
MISLFQIFFTFFKIGALTFGGGLAMIPVIEREIVLKGWISEDELNDYIAVSQSAPGMIAVNIATLVGIHLRKRIGALMAVLGVVLPSFIAIIFIAMFLREFDQIPLVQSALRGIMIVVIILLAFALFNLGKKAIKNIYLLLYALLSFGLIYFLNVPTSLIILMSFVLGTLHTYLFVKKVKK